MKKKLYFTTSVAPLLAVILVVTSCGGASNKKKETKMTTNTSEMVRLPSGLRYQELKAAPANAKPAVVGKHAIVHYSGYLNDGNDGLGTKFDSSFDRNAPFEFPLGAGYVISGWDQGVALMKVGQKIRFFIPAALGYGSRGAGRIIPPNSDLIFDVELVEVR